LENSSFIASSVFLDKNLVGTGFVARLSGSTAEFLHIWRIITAGENPFFLNNSNELNLRFAPLLAGWLFRQDGTFSFNFLGSIRVTYHNPKRKNTFGQNAAVIKKILINHKDGSSTKLSSDTIPRRFAEQIRSRLIQQIDIFLN
jgi:hypothetical protein